MAKLSFPLVDRLCDELFLSRRAREQDDNLQFVRNRLLRSEVDLAGLLDLYRQVQRGRPVKDDETNPLARVLRLSGVVRVEQGRLHVRNRIYDRAFDREWVLTHMPGAELRRQRAAYRRGLLRATAISASVVGAMAMLSFLAISQTRLAREATAQRTIALQQAVKERNHAEHEARLAREAERQTKVALRQAEARRHEAEFQRREAKRQSEEALRQAGIAGAREAEAQRAKQAATERLRDSYLAQARARRWSGQPGQRFESLAALARAAALNPPPELRLQLRNEAIAALALPVDVGEAVYYWRNKREGPRVVGLDLERGRYFRSDRNGGISLRRLGNDREILRLPGFGEPVRMIWRQSRDGRFVDAFYEDREDHILWDLARRSIVMRPERFPNPDFSPDGRWIAAGAPGSKGVFCKMALPTGREQGRTVPELRAMALLFDPPGRRAAVTLYPDSHEVRIVDLATGNTMALPPAGFIANLSWSPDGTWLAGASGDHNLYLWNVAARQPPMALKGHVCDVSDVAFNHRGDLLASASGDATRRLWDPRTGRQLLSLPSDGGHVSFSRDDRLLISIGSDETWARRIEGGREHRTLYTAEGPNSANMIWGEAFSPDGRLLVSAETRGARLWDVARGKEIALLPVGHTRSAFFSPDGRTLITSSLSGLRRWPIGQYLPDAGKPLRIGPPSLLPVPAGMRPLTANQSRDGSTLAVGRLRPDGAMDGAYLYGGAGNTLARFFSVPPDVGTAVTLSPDGRWLAIGTWEDVGVHLWDVHRGRRGPDLPSESGAYPAFSPDGRWLLVGSTTECRFWQVDVWRPGVRVFRERGGHIAFSPDGRLLAVTHLQNRVILIDPRIGRQLATLESPNPVGLGPLCFSPDSALLAAAGSDPEIQLWDLRLIRKRLAVMGLDWDLPPYPPSRQGPRGAGGGSLTPLRVRVVAGREDHTP